MAHIISYNPFNRILLLFVLISFTITYNIPLSASQPTLNEVAFFVRLEKLVEKLVNSEKKNPDSMIDAVSNIKWEIERSFNITINTDYFIDEVGKEIKKTGQKTPKKELEVIKKKLKKNDKHRFLSNTLYTLKDKKKEDKDDKEEIVLPSLLVYGVACSLCGVLLMVLPIPACKEWGGRMVVAGITACANSICAKTDENIKEEKKKGR